MKYVSAQRMPSETGDEFNGPIKAIGDDGLVYWVSSITSDVPPWPEYLSGGGIIAPPEPPVAQQILDVPDTLTGGPTIEEVFHGNP